MYGISKSQIASIDNSDMFKIIAGLSNQLETGFEICNNVSLDYDYSRIKNIVFCGMGGSSIGGMLLKEYLSSELGIPFVIVRNFEIPSFVNKETLLFVSSFSGKTDESLSVYDAAKRLNAQVIALTSGGILKQYAIEDNVPFLPIPPLNIPPRCAIGYSIILPLLILAKLGLVKDKTEDIKETIDILKKQEQEFTSIEQPEENRALSLAYKLKNKLPVIYCQEQFLGPVGYRWKCQFNENSKRTSFNNYFTELNHNEICGWDSDYSRYCSPYVVILKDKKNENGKINKIIEITQSILNEENIPVEQFSSTGESLLSRIFSLLYLGDWTSYYLAVINNTDPTPIIKIEEIKKRMNKNNY